MNKNTVFAFILIAITVIFFNSSAWNNFWYGTILKKPVPIHYQSREQRAAAAAKAAEEVAAASGDSVDIKVITPKDSSVETSVSVTESAIDNTSDADINAAEYEDSTAVIQVVEDTIIVETNRLIAAISTKGARLISIKVKDYTYQGGSRKGEFIDLIPAGSAGGAQLSINNESFDEKFFDVVQSDYNLVFETKSSAGKPIQKIFTFADDTYKIGYTVRGDVVLGQKVTIGWEGGIDDPDAAGDMPFGQAGLDKRRAHYSDGKSVSHFEMKKTGTEEPSGMFRWVGVSSKHFFIALVADRVSDADLKIAGRDVSVKRSPKDPPSINYSLSYQFEAESGELENWIYAGPAKITELSGYGLKFEKSLYPILSWARHIFWADAWFPPLAELTLKLLLFFYGLVKDYGVAIFLLTLLTKLITYPMTQSSNKSMIKMREIQPKIAALRQKYKGNPQKMNQEMMALYKAEGVNPLNPGCLPMFLQMPIFIALFVVLRKAIELRGASSFLLPWVKDLSMPEALFYLPGNGLPIYGNNVALMPILMAALTFFQQKQVITDPNQKMMIYMMPIIMLVMFNGFPAGVVFYWTVSSALGLVQQTWLKPKALRASGATATVTTSSGTQKVPVKKVPGAMGGNRKQRRSGM